MGDVKIIRVNGGLGKTLPTQDHVSGIIFYNDKNPSGWLSDISDWVTATAYAIGDKVFNVDTYYIANTAHTSGATFAGDSSNWTVYTNTAVKFSSMVEIESAGILENSVDYSYEWYQLSEYFRIMPEGEIWVRLAKVPASAYNYNEIIEMQNQSNGNIRQIGIFANLVTFATAEVDKLQVHANTLETENRPVQLLYTAEFSTFTDITTLPDLSELSTPAYNVSVVLGQDGANVGHTLSASDNGALGATLGAVSYAKVNESIAWVEKFNIASTELDVPALANGQLLSDLTTTVIDGISDKNYIYIKKYESITGSYFNDSKTSDNDISDYSDIELNRVYHKAFRGIRKNLLPLLNKPLKVMTGGLLAPSTVNYFSTTASKTLIEMVNNTELVDFNVTVDNTQNVFDTQKVNINARMLPFGKSKYIDVTLGYDINI